MMKERKKRRGVESEGVSRPSEEKKTESLPQVFIVEDEEMDRELLRIAFSKNKSSGEFELRFFEDGESLITFLRTQEVTPGLIIFDINLPGISGLEALEKIRAQNLIDSETATIVLSSSQRSQDLSHADLLKADCYYVKPVESSGWLHLAGSIYQAWIRP